MPGPSPSPSVIRVPIKEPSGAALPQRTIGIAGVLLALGGLLVLLLLGVGRRRRALAAHRANSDATAPGDVPLRQEPPSQPPAKVRSPVAETPQSNVAPPAARPWIELDFRPKRAGTNLLNAAVEFELVARNVGPVQAEDVRILVRMLTAGPHQNDQLKAAFATGLDEPILTPFALEPGAAVSIQATGSLLLDKINRVDLKGRPMFVPILAVRAIYGWRDGADGTTAHAYIIGIDRAGGDKMQPFWLDTPSQMTDRITYRRHETGIHR